MRKRWYAEEKNFSGVGKPVAFPDDPRQAGLNKYRLSRLSNVREVPPQWQDDTLDRLAKRFAEAQ